MENTSNHSNSSQDIRDGIDLLSIFGKEKLEQIQKLISDVTGIAFVAIDYKGEPLTKMTNFTKHCANIRKNPICKRICELSDASGAIRAAVTKKTSIYLCPFDMLEVAIPIIIDDTYLGALVGGQIDCPNPPADILKIEEKWILGNEKIEDLESKKDLSSGKVLKYQDFVNSVKLVEFIITEIISKEIQIRNMDKSYKNNISILEKDISLLEKSNKNLEERLQVLGNNINKNVINDLLEILSNLSILADKNLMNFYIDNLAFFAINFVNKTILPIDEISDLVKSYLEIKKIQYSDRFTYNISVDQSISNFLISYRPIIIYTVLMANISLKYLDEAYHMDLNISSKDNKIIVKISDNGIGVGEKSMGILKKTYITEYESIEISSYLAYIKHTIEDSKDKEVRIVEENKENQVLIKYEIGD